MEYLYLNIIFLLSTVYARVCMCARVYNNVIVLN